MSVDSVLEVLTRTDVDRGWRGAGVTVGDIHPSDTNRSGSAGGHATAPFLVASSAPQFSSSRIVTDGVRFAMDQEELDSVPWSPLGNSPHYVQGNLPPFPDAPLYLWPRWTLLPPPHSKALHPKEAVYPKTAFALFSSALLLLELFNS